MRRKNKHSLEKSWESERQAVHLYRVLADVESEESKRQLLRELADEAAAQARVWENRMKDDVVLMEDYAHPAYGIPSEETNEAVQLCARMEGMMTDPVYEGKSMQGLMDLVRKGFFLDGSKILLRIGAECRRSTRTATSIGTDDFTE
jgi:1-aminocyclopropane-1-carboxylate deaminase